jgi:hypothetical protein
MFMRTPLLDRQLSLLKHLTSADVIFGVRHGAAIDPALRGIDPALLRLEARFSHDKRMEKIAAVFPRTFALLGLAREAILRDFVAACPPHDIGRLENARQFHEFLPAHWGQQAPQPVHLPDIAACELACATVRAQAELGADGADEGATGLRRRRGVILLRCGFNVRPIFEQSNTDLTPETRDTPLAVVLADASREPEIFELAPVLFELLAALDDWTPLDAFEAAPEAAALVDELQGAGLIEVRR